LVNGERSGLLTPAVRDYMLGIAPTGTPLVDTFHADHHVMIDQPLAFVTALRSLLQTMPDPVAEG
jgi:hypothetical protein